MSLGIAAGVFVPIMAVKLLCKAYLKRMQLQEE